MSGSNSATEFHLPTLPTSASLAQWRQSVSNDLRAMNVGEVRFEKHDRMLYATDASMYQVEPIGVVILNRPESAIDIVRYCRPRSIPMLPRGGGTSLAGQCVNHALVMDMSARCRGIRGIDIARGTVTVEPGVTLDQLNAELGRHGMMFGPDVATSGHATLGGMIGNNSAGARSIVHGRTVENVIGMRVVTAEGVVMDMARGSCDVDPIQGGFARRLAELALPLAREIDTRVPKILRHVDGFNVDILLGQLRSSAPGTFDQVNLAQLMCGSEGTLGVMIEATLRIVPKPARTGLAIIGFASIEDALAPLMRLIGTKPSAVELVDDVVLEAARGNSEYRHYVDLMPRPATGKLGAVMYVEYQGDSESQLNAKFDSLTALVSDGNGVPGVPGIPGGASIKRYLSADAIASAWKLRKAGEPLLHNVPGDRKPMTFVEDTAVDPSKLLQFVNDFKAIVTRHGTTAAYYAHASVGCLHIRPLVKISDEASRSQVAAIAVEVADLVANYGGALSGEHGDGRLRTPLLERVLGKELCGLFRDIKSLFDPLGLMNPGNLVDSFDPSLIMRNLRVKPHERDISIQPTSTFFRFGKEHGFNSAVESCNGAGLCRRTQPTGVMCPSYRATLDERHSTRGRGNALRLALSGQLQEGGLGAPGQPWSDPETKATLDLCLSCKACQRECPSNVDISKLKAEFQAQEFAARGKVPMRARVIGGVRKINRMGSLLWPLANALARFTPMANCVRWALGFHPARTMPTFGPATHRWLARANRRAAGDPSIQSAAPAPGNGQSKARPTLMLFADCFTNFNETHISRHAVELLQAFGYRVVMPEVGCCGRSMISVGMLAQASLVCARTAARILEIMHGENAVALLALEPSCLSAIKDDWLDLKMDIPARKLEALAAGAMLVEEFLDARWNEHPCRPEIAVGRERVLFHGHCHQKALWGNESGARLLRRLFGDRLNALDSGCCGMAGSFGFARHRYDLSMAIGEQSLFPAIRAEPESVVVAPGASCRHQIRDGTDAAALHPIELIAKLVVPRTAPLRSTHQ